MASVSKRHHQGILSVLDHHYSDDSNSITMKVGGPTPSLLRRSVSTADMSYNDQIRKSGDVNSWFAPKISEPEEAPPYVHPLVKKSASAVSLKSLEACTESLGSESGSDGFSSLQDQDNKQVDTTQTFTRKKINKGNPKPFPPPITSLSYHHHHHQEEGQGRQPLRVRSHRDLGRLVLEATAFPLHTNNFQAQRQDGRLLLAFTDKKDEDDIKDEVVEGEEDDEDETRVLKSCKDARKTSLIHSLEPHLVLTS